MTNEERQALLSLVGVTYGEQKKVDQNIVGASVNLQHKSDQLKSVFQQVMVGNAPPAPPLPTFTQPIPQQTYTPEFVQGISNELQRTKELEVLLEIVRKLDILIETIKVNKNGIKPKKTANRKVSKLNIEN